MDRDTLTVDIAGVSRDLPLIQVAPGIVIPVFNMLGDPEVVEAAANVLAPRVPSEVEVLVTTEAKPIPLAHTIAVRTGLPYVVLRKSYQPYMGAVIEAEVLVITTGKRQRLYLEEKDRERVHGRRVLLVDDVVSTGSNSQAMRALMKRAGADVIGEMAVFTEGTAARWPDVIAVGHLPLFPEALD